MQSSLCETTLNLLRNRFKRAVNDALDKPSDCVIEAKMRVSICNIECQNRDLLNSLVEIVKELDNCYLFHFIHWTISHFFIKHCNWERIVCMHTIVDILTKNELQHFCQGNVKEYCKYYLNSGMIEEIAGILNDSTESWIIEQGGWAKFLIKDFSSPESQNCQNHTIMQLLWLLKIY